MHTKNYYCQFRDKKCQFMAIFLCIMIFILLLFVNLRCKFKMYDLRLFLTINLGQIDKRMFRFPDRDNICTFRYNKKEAPFKIYLALSWG